MNLLKDEEIIRIIWEWSISKEVQETLCEDAESPGVSILMELYKGADYRIRKNITHILYNNIKVLRFTAELITWLI